MNIEKYITKRKFNMLSREYVSRTGVPLILVVLHSNRAHVCGPSGDDPTVYSDLDPGQVERICSEAQQMMLV